MARGRGRPAHACLDEEGHLRVVDRSGAHGSGNTASCRVNTRGAPLMCGPTRFPEVRLAGIRFHAVTRSRCVAHVLSELDAGRGGWVLSLGLDRIRRLVRDRSFRDLCRSADLVVPNSAPLVWASRLQGTPLPERVMGTDLVSTLAQAAALDGRSIYLLSSQPGLAHDAADTLAERFPALDVAGLHAAPPGSERSAPDFDRLARHLTEARPDIVCVGLASPEQERWIQRLRPLLPDTWWIGFGVGLGDAAGALRRGARGVSTRTLLGSLPFAAQLLAGAAGKRLFGSGTAPL